MVLNFELKTWKFRAFRRKILRKSDFWCCRNGFPYHKRHEPRFFEPDIGSKLRYLSFIRGDKRSRRYLCFFSNDYWGRWFWILSWKLESLEHFVWKSFVNMIFGVVEMGFLFVKGTNHGSVTLMSVLHYCSLLWLLGVSDRCFICVSTCNDDWAVDFEFWVENLKV